MTNSNRNAGKNKSSRKRRARTRYHRKLLLTILLMLILLAAAIVLLVPGLARDNPIVSELIASMGSETVLQDEGSQTVENEPVIIIKDETETTPETQPLTEAENKQTEVQTEAQTAAAAAVSAGDSAATASLTAEEALSGTVSEAIAYADRLAAGYDYDGAIAFLQQRPDVSDPSIQEAVSSYETTKASCEPVDVTTVPHIFYHSLVNDPDTAFNSSVLGQFAADGMNAWMTTVDEFDKITQQLYDNGYVYVRLRDLVTETVDADGTVHFSPRTDLLLPPGKKAIVLSIDDLSYYHSYEAASFPDKLVLDENGNVKCHYTLSDGTESIGDYDVVPRLNTFLEEHPDGAYQGARGLIALTGYNGVFGYRTDIDYEAKEHLMSDQLKWLEQHPDYSREEEIRQATVIAEALKAEGWEFASHTWGHLSVTEKTVEELAADNQKWISNVQNIVGETDTIIFAHGNDIGDWMPYSDDNEKYQMYKEAGYRFFCNVDGSVPYWVQINDSNVRQGRINLDGYMLYQSSIGATTTIDQLITASEIFDARRPTPVVANGQG